MQPLKSGWSFGLSRIPANETGVAKAVRSGGFLSARYQIARRADILSAWLQGGGGGSTRWQAHTAKSRRERDGFHTQTGQPKHHNLYPASRVGRSGRPNI